MGLKIAGIQMYCREDKDGNVQKALRLGELAAGNGAQIGGARRALGVVRLPLCL